MTQSKPKIRLYVPEPFATGEVLTLPEGQSHYLAHVMRQKVGESVAVFNGRDGEWEARIERIAKKQVALSLVRQLAAQRSIPDMWLVFAPIKNKTELVVEKAVELGASQLHAVYTQHAVVRSINHDKLTAHAVEAAEQCGRHDVPPLKEHKDLSTLLGSWPQERTLFYADESGGGLSLKQTLPTLISGKHAVLVGPEGGFSTGEHQMLKQMPFVKAFSLGPLILRADTAAVASLACLQSWLHWDEQPAFDVRD